LGEIEIQLAENIMINGIEERYMRFYGRIVIRTTSLAAV